MSQKSSTSCPNCGSDKCLYGSLVPWDDDSAFNGHFYPLHIKEHGWLVISEPKVKLPNKERFYACYECGHLWSKVNLSSYKSVVAECGWKGGEQIPPKPGKPYFWIISCTIFSVFILFILYVKLT